MIDKYPQNLTASHLTLSTFILLSTISSNSLKTQAVNTTQLPNSNFILSQKLPPPQDLQPPAPLPVPSPELPPPQDLQPPAPLPVPSPELPQPLPPPIELLPPSVRPPLPDEAPVGNFPKSIVVKRFEVIGSTVFSPEELAKATAEFTKRPISLSELYQARYQITQLYLRNGYITSGAYIPPQTIKSGVVKIQVLEGRLEDIQVIGTRRLNPNYVRSRVALGISTPLNRQRLLEALQLLQLNPLIQKVSTELSPGSRAGANILEVKITEAKTFSSQIVLDNGRSPSVGSFRRRLQLNQANLLGFGDALGVTYTNTDGSNSLEASYTLPLNPHNGTLTFNYGTTASNVIEPPFNALDIQSASRYYEVTFRQPIIQTPTQEFALGLTASRRESNISWILQRQYGTSPSVLSFGADEQGRTNVSALQFFQEWTSRNSHEVIALHSQFTLGIDILNPTINQNAPDSRFFAWRGQAQWVRLLAPETLFLLRLNTQLASRPLLPLEQFGLGGQDSVRGYRQDYLLTDNGTFVSAEVQVPILRLPQMNGTLQAVPFVDFGVGWNSSDIANPKYNTLAAIGLGLRWSQGDRFSARLDWGVPLMSADFNQRTLQENGLYFSLVYNSF